MLNLLFAAGLAAALPHGLVDKRQEFDCSPRAAGAGPSTTPDTADAFEANPAYSQIATAAATPEGYAEVFEDLNGSSLQLNDYLQLQVALPYRSLTRIIANFAIATTSIPTAPPSVRKSATTPRAVPLSTSTSSATQSLSPPLLAPILLPQQPSSVLCTARRSPEALHVTMDSSARTSRLSLLDLMVRSSEVDINGSFLTFNSQDT